jgi:hypothetical protein
VYSLGGGAAAGGAAGGGAASSAAAAGAAASGAAAAGAAAAAAAAAAANPVVVPVARPVQIVRQVPSTSPFLWVPFRWSTGPAGADADADLQCWNDRQIDILHHSSHLG